MSGIEKVCKGTRSRVKKDRPVFYTVCSFCRSKIRVKVTQKSLKQTEADARDGIFTLHAYKCCPKLGYEAGTLDEFVKTTEEKWARISQRKGWR